MNYCVFSHEKTCLLSLRTNDIVSKKVLKVPKGSKPVNQRTCNILDKEEGRQSTAQHTTDLATQTQLKNGV